MEEKSDQEKTDVSATLNKLNERANKTEENVEKIFTMLEVLTANVTNLSAVITGNKMVQPAVEIPPPQKAMETPRVQVPSKNTEKYTLTEAAGGLKYPSRSATEMIESKREERRASGIILQPSIEDNDDSPPISQNSRQLESEEEEYKRYREFRGYQQDEFLHRENGPPGPIFYINRQDSIYGEQNKDPNARELPFRLNLPPKKEGDKEFNIIRSLTMADSFARESDYNKIVYYQPVPSQDGISLDYLNLTVIFAFFDNVIAYQQRYFIPIKISRMVSRKVVRQLCATYRGLSETTFYSLDNEMATRVIVDMIRPENRVEFMDTLRKSIHFEFKDSQKADALHYKQLYFHLLVLRYNFERYFEILALSNVKNTPPCNDKPGGLIKFFVDLIPVYGRKVYQEINDRKYDNIYVFLTHFYKVVDLHQAYAREARSFQQYFNPQSVYEDVKKISAQSYQNKSGFSRSASDRPSYNVTQRVHAMYPQLNDEVGNEEQDEDVGNGAGQDQEEDTKEEVPVLNNDYDVFGDDTPYMKPTDMDYHSGDEENFTDSRIIRGMYDHIDTMEEELNAITSGGAGSQKNIKILQNKNRNASSNKTVDNQKQRVVNACIDQVLTGKCSRGDKCSYSHKAEDLQRKHDEMSKQLTSSPYKKSSSGYAPQYMPSRKHGSA